MESVLEDRFVVYLRSDSRHDDHPDWAEEPLAVCSTYEDARRAQREVHHLSHCKTVIRFIGPAGGGD
jgi:hypothetical protein